MQKKIIALAIAGLASTAAFAQSNVTIYGRMDLGGVYRDGNSGGVSGTEGKYEIASGVGSGSRIGFKGVEDLGNGLKAVFQSEFGISLDEPKTAGSATSANWTNRNSYVGLTGGFGTVVAGRLDGVRYGVFNTYDPFAGGTIGNFTQMTIQIDRADNAIAYISPNFSGFGLVLAYSSSTAGAEQAGNRFPGGAAGGTGALHTIMGTYDNGPLSARLDYEEVTFPGESYSKTWVVTAAGSYDFGAVKVSALIDQIKNKDAGLKQQAWLIGAKAPMGKATLKAMIGGVKNKITDDADSLKWALGVDYALSKRTYVYANYGQIKNDDGATRTITWAANSNSGYGTTGVDFGIAHSF
jgi:predicted porin